MRTMGSDSSDCEPRLDYEKRVLRVTPKDERKLFNLLDADVPNQLQRMRYYMVALGAAIAVPKATGHENIVSLIGSIFS